MKIVNPDKDFNEEDISKNKETYSIREISIMYGLPASTLRYYEDMGLLVHVGRKSNHQRIYTREHIERLDGIQCFKNAGLQIGEIQTYYKLESNLEGNISQILQLVKDHERNVCIRISKMQNELSHLQDKVYYYTIVKEALEQGRPQPRWDEVVKSRKKL